MISLYQYVIYSYIRKVNNNSALIKESVGFRDGAAPGHSRFFITKDVSYLFLGIKDEVVKLNDEFIGHA